MKNVIEEKSYKIIFSTGQRGKFPILVDILVNKSKIHIFNVRSLYGPTYDLYMAHPGMDPMNTICCQFLDPKTIQIVFTDSKKYILVKESK